LIPSLNTPDGAVDVISVIDVIGVVGVVGAVGVIRGQAKIA